MPSLILTLWNVIKNLKYLTKITFPKEQVAFFDFNCKPPD